MGRYVLWTLGIIAVWVLLIAYLPRPACQAAAWLAVLVLPLVAVLSVPLLCCYGTCAAIGFYDKRPAGSRLQFTLRSLFASISIAGLALCTVINFRSASDYVFGVAFDADTIYSQAYSALGWMQIRPGMRKARVVELLGQPVKKTSIFDNEDWQYTAYGSSESYHRREVHFSNDVVAEKLAELYID